MLSKFRNLKKRSALLHSPWAILLSSSERQKIWFVHSFLGHIELWHMLVIVPIGTVKGAYAFVFLSTLRLKFNSFLFKMEVL